MTQHDLNWTAPFPPDLEAAERDVKAAIAAELLAGHSPTGITPVIFLAGTADGPVVLVAGQSDGSFRCSYQDRDAAA